MWLKVWHVGKGVWFQEEAVNNNPENNAYTELEPYMYVRSTTIITA